MGGLRFTPKTSRNADAEQTNVMIVKSPTQSAKAHHIFVCRFLSQGKHNDYYQGVVYTYVSNPEQQPFGDLDPKTSFCYQQIDMPVKKHYRSSLSQAWSVFPNTLLKFNFECKIAVYLFMIQWIVFYN